MKAKGEIDLRSGGSRAGSRPHSARAARRTEPYPAGSIGADVMKRGYVKYLIERYHRCREMEILTGRLERLRYGLIFKNIEAKFQGPTYFISQKRFPELVDFLQERIDGTLLGRKNNSRGVANFKSFDEYRMRLAESRS